MSFLQDLITEVKGIRRVRTPAGVAYFKLPIGSIITRDVREAAKARHHRKPAAPKKVTRSRPTGRSGDSRPSKLSDIAHHGEGPQGAPRKTATKPVDIAPTIKVEKVTKYDQYKGRTYTGYRAVGSDGWKGPTRWGTNTGRANPAVAARHDGEDHVKDWEENHVPDKPKIKTDVTHRYNDKEYAAGGALKDPAYPRYKSPEASKALREMPMGGKIGYTDLDGNEKFLEKAPGQAPWDTPFLKTEDGDFLNGQHMSWQVFLKNKSLNNVVHFPHLDKADTPDKPAKKSFDTNTDNWKKPVKGKVEVATRDGKVSKDADLYGPFAVHPGSMGDIKNGFVVTHRNSGLMIAIFKSKQEAIVFVDVVSDMSKKEPNYWNFDKRPGGNTEIGRLPVTPEELRKHGSAHGSIQTGNIPFIAKELAKGTADDETKKKYKAVTGKDFGGKTDTPVVANHPDRPGGSLTRDELTALADRWNKGLNYGESGTTSRGQQRVKISDDAKAARAEYLSKLGFKIGDRVSYTDENGNSGLGEVTDLWPGALDKTNLPSNSHRNDLLIMVRKDGNKRSTRVHTDLEGNSGTIKHLNSPKPPVVDVPDKPSVPAKPAAPSKLEDVIAPPLPPGYKLTRLKTGIQISKDGKSIYIYKGPDKDTDAGMASAAKEAWMHKENVERTKKENEKFDHKGASVSPATKEFIDSVRDAYDSGNFDFWDQMQGQERFVDQRANELADEYDSQQIKYEELLDIKDQVDAGELSPGEYPSNLDVQIQHYETSQKTRLKAIETLNAFADIENPTEADMTPDVMEAMGFYRSDDPARLATAFKGATMMVPSSDAKKDIHGRTIPSDSMLDAHDDMHDVGMEMIKEIKDSINFDSEVMQLRRDISDMQATEPKYPYLDSTKTTFEERSAARVQYIKDKDAWNAKYDPDRDPNVLGGPSAVQKKKAALARRERQIKLDYLNSIRPMGPHPEATPQFDSFLDPSRAPDNWKIKSQKSGTANDYQRMIDEATVIYPTSWLAQVPSRYYKMAWADRAWHMGPAVGSDSENPPSMGSIDPAIALHPPGHTDYTQPTSAFKDGNEEAAAHEFMHALETWVPGITAVQWAGLYDRAGRKRRGGNWEPPKHVPGTRRDELKAMEDEFTHTYAGKINETHYHPVQGHGEMFSTGVEDVFGRSYDDKYFTKKGDDHVEALILGMMATLNYFDDEETWRQNHG